MKKDFEKVLQQVKTFPNPVIPFVITKDGVNALGNRYVYTVAT